MLHICTNALQVILAYEADRKISLSLFTHLDTLKLRQWSAHLFSVLQKCSSAVQQMPESILHGFPGSFILALEFFAQLLHLAGNQALQHLQASAQG